MEATTTLSNHYSRDVEGAEMFIMKRLHQIVRGDGNGPFDRTYGYRWQLDASNDWWAQLDGRVLKVAHRYSQAKADAVANLVGLLFGDGTINLPQLGPVQGHCQQGLPPHLPGHTYSVRDTRNAALMEAAEVAFCAELGNEKLIYSAIIGLKHK